MEATEGNWPRAEQLARDLAEGAADPSHGARVPGPRRFQGAALRGRRRALQGGQRQPHRRADQHAGAGLALPGAGQDPGGAGPARRAQAAGLGAVLPALSPGAARRPGRASRRGARRLRAHPQERPAHAAHHARLRAPRRQRRRHQAGAEHAQGALRADQERRPSGGARAAGADRGRRAPGAADHHARRGLAEAFYGLGEALTGRRRHQRRRHLPAVRPLPRCPSSRSRWPTLANAYETTKRYDGAIAAYDRIPKGTPLQIEHRYPQGPEPQPARARRRGAEAAGRDRARRTPATSARSTRSAASCAATSALPRPSTTTRAPSR